MTLERKITLTKERIEKNEAFLEANRNDLDEKTIETLQKVIDNEKQYLINISQNHLFDQMLKNVK